MGLNDFIQKLVSTPHICQHVEVNNFLKIDENQNEETEKDSPMCLSSRSSLAEDTQIKPCDFDYLKIIGKGSFGKVGQVSVFSPFTDQVELMECGTSKFINAAVNVGIRYYCYYQPNVT